jgi:hypothetical protein
MSGETPVILSSTMPCKARRCSRLVHCISCFRSGLNAIWASTGHFVGVVVLWKQMVRRTRFAKIPPLCCPARVRFIPDPRMPSGQSGCCPILKSLTAFRSLVPTIRPNLATLLRAYSLEKFPIIPTNLCVKAVEKFNLSNDAMRH